MRRILLVALLAGAAAAVVPLLVHAVFVPVEFNQFMLQNLELRYWTISREMLGDLLRSSYLSGVQVLSGTPHGEEPGIEDPEEVFSYIFSWISPHAVVYPTEGFYYFATRLDRVGDISGNVRVADLDKGIMSMAYFTIPDKRTRYGNFSHADGLAVEKISDSLYGVTWRGKTVWFKIPSTDWTGPQAMRMLPEEEFVGQIHDESGIRLFLLFNHQTDSFYMVLNEEAGVPESFASLNGTHVIGKRTGFVFYRDEAYSRSVLVGIDLNNTEQNNFLDGPGDQVPFRADLRTKLHRAYPSTLLGAGVDGHGVILNRTEWARFVVGPFHRYTDPGELLARAANCALEPRSVFWTCLTKEWWNTPEWRQEIIGKLAAEGKNYTEIIEKEASAGR